MMPSLSPTLSALGPTLIALLTSLPLLTMPQSGCDDACPDADADGVCDPEDTCPNGPDDLDSNTNGIPDACEAPITIGDGQFILSGLPFRFVGANTYYLMSWAADPQLRPAVDEVLEEAAARGIRVIRTWGFSEGSHWNSLQPQPGLYDEQVFQGLDYVVARAGELGLRLLIPLVNYWPDYGGMDQYVAWSETAHHRDEFYTDSTTRALYRNHLETLTARVNVFTGIAYRDDPMILGWALANEPRCPSDPSGETLEAWIREMAAELKALDPQHPITVGMEGFYADGAGPWYLNGSQGIDFVRHHQLPGIDFAVAHSWPDGWGLSREATFDLVMRQLQDATTLLQMPFVLEEFGKARDGMASASSDLPLWNDAPVGHTLRPASTTDARADALPHAHPEIQPAPEASTSSDTVTRDAYFEDWLELLASQGGAGGIYWASYHDDYPDYDGFGVYDPADSSTLAVIDASVDRMAGAWEP